MKELRATIKLGSSTRFEDFEPHTVFDCERNADFIAEYKNQVLRQIKRKASEITLKDLKFEELEVPKIDFTEVNPIE